MFRDSFIASGYDYLASMITILQSKFGCIPWQFFPQIINHAQAPSKVIACTCMLVNQDVIMSKPKLKNIDKINLTRKVL